MSCSYAPHGIYLNTTCIIYVIDLAFHCIDFCSVNMSAFLSFAGWSG